MFDLSCTYDTGPAQLPFPNNAGATGYFTPSLPTDVYER